jgi:hypothetical protein
MGRQIRRVPANWQHPEAEGDDLRRGRGYTPLYGLCYKTEAEEWVKNCLLWSQGRHPDQLDGSGKDCEFFWEWDGDPPDRKYYVQYDPDDKDLCTWWQLYETVSEGTPVSPAFATADELIDYLATHGDFWEQRRAREGHRPLQLSSRETLEKFVKNEGSAPSLVVIDEPGKPHQVAEGIEAVALLERQRPEEER